MVIFSLFPSLFLDGKEPYGKEVGLHATTMERCAHRVSQRWSACWQFSEDSPDTTMITGLWQAPALRQKPEAASWEHLSLAHAGGHI
jgi:hypothetical protein